MLFMTTRQHALTFGSLLGRTLKQRFKTTGKGGCQLKHYSNNSEELSKHVFSERDNDALAFHVVEKQNWEREVISGVFYCNLQVPSPALL